MVDRCVVCGELVPEGTWVCGKCKLSNSTPPCYGCKNRKTECHVYCKKYLAYFKASQRNTAIIQKKKNEDEYFMKKAKRHHFARKDQYKEQ